MRLLFGWAEGRIEDTAAPGRIEKLSEQAALDDFALSDSLQREMGGLVGEEDALEPCFGESTFERDRNGSGDEGYAFRKPAGE